MDKELVNAVEHNCLAIYYKLSEIFATAQSVEGVLQLVEEGGATEENVNEAIADIRAVKEILAATGDTLIKTIPSYESPKEATAASIGLPQPKKIGDINDYRELAYVGEPDTGFPGTVSIDFRTE